MADENERVDNFLAHYGVLGMKWGVRKDRQGRNAPNPNYTENQRKRDKQVYGRRGSKRVNRALNTGASISVARGDEKTRRDRVMGRNPYVRQAGKVGGGIVSFIATSAGIAGLHKTAHSRAAQAFVGNLLKNAPSPVKTAAAGTFLGAQKVSDLLNDTTVGLIASSGAAAVGAKLSGDIAVAANMRAHGYDPTRK